MQRLTISSLFAKLNPVFHLARSVPAAPHRYHPPGARKPFVPQHHLPLQKRTDRWVGHVPRSCVCVLSNVTRHTTTLSGKRMAWLGGEGGARNAMQTKPTFYHLTNIECHLLVGKNMMHVFCCCYSSSGICFFRLRYGTLVLTGSC